MITSVVSIDCLTLAIRSSPPILSNLAVLVAILFSLYLANVVRPSLLPPLS